jgi:hypothetical protein
MNVRLGLAASFVATTLALGAAMGCSDNAGSTTDAGSHDATSSGSGGSSGGSGGTGGDGGSGSDGGSSGGGPYDGPISLDCPTYCALVMTNCTGDNAQYAAMSECLNACSLLPLGTLGDSTGNTLACRLYHGGAAASAPNPHCWHAGPYGFGGCDLSCNDFCAFAVQWCSPSGGFDGGPPPFTDMASCIDTVCNRVPSGTGANGAPFLYNASGPTSGNTVDCREWHLGMALVDHSATGQQLHCNHVGASSPTCM